MYPSEKSTTYDVFRKTYMELCGQRYEYSVSVISKGLGHDNQLTTTIYLSNINSEAIDKANKKIIKALR
ncbi:MAG: hypothetical protein RR386_07575 [Bacteroidaceae bacterium]